MNWILKAFNFIAEGIYYIRIGQNKTFISLISKRKLSELQKTQQYGGSLRIKFKGLTKTSVYDWIWIYDNNFNYESNVSFCYIMKIDQNLVAVVTGGSSGLGLATVQLLTSLGAKVVIADIN